MTFNIGICDDDINQISFLKSLLKDWAEKNNYNLKIKEFNNAESFLFHYEEEKNFDILLLDIEMGEINGVELAKKVRKEDETLQIVFITGYSDYIIEGYEVSALHYLMKPVNTDKLFQTLNRAVEKLKHNEKFLFLETIDGNIKIPFYQIEYIEVIKNYITVYAKEEYTSKITLTDIEKLLDNSFFKTSRSYIVRLSAIKKITKTSVVLNSLAEIPISRGMYQKLNQAIINS